MLQLTLPLLITPKVRLHNILLLGLFSAFEGLADAHVFLVHIFS